MTLIDRERRHYRCPECASRNVRVFAVAKVLVDISDQPASSSHFGHFINEFSNQITDAWGMKTSAFICMDCEHESRSWNRNADALETAVEWSEVSA